jgi:hypothetical protein
MVYFIRDKVILHLTGESSNEKHTTDPFLEKRITVYDQWLKNGQISYASKVIPVAESLNPEQWVLPTEQVMKILAEAKSVAVQNCECST